jgi:hypothetical protein
MVSPFVIQTSGGGKRKNCTQLFCLAPAPDQLLADLIHVLHSSENGLATTLPTRFKAKIT